MDTCRLSWHFFVRLLEVPIIRPPENGIFPAARGAHHFRGPRAKHVLFAARCVHNFRKGPKKRRKKNTCFGRSIQQQLLETNVVFPVSLRPGFKGNLLDICFMRFAGRKTWTFWGMPTDQNRYRVVANQTQGLWALAFGIAELGRML